ncbi:hypothetical protein [Tenacibaculum amylolyticum]|uniref:hypothetical protein n=1 Tax=Tenacibaculum amylolyticum TaxID=104269 RepID=UPI0038963E56
MNKLERRLKGYYKYKKRLKNYSFNESKAYVLKTTGKPCSCFMCSPKEEKPKYKLSKHKAHHSISVMYLYDFC